MRTRAGRMDPTRANGSRLQDRSIRTSGRVKMMLSSQKKKKSQLRSAPRGADKRARRGSDARRERPCRCSVRGALRVLAARAGRASAPQTPCRCAVRAAAARSAHLTLRRPCRAAAPRSLAALPRRRCPRRQGPRLLRRRRVCRRLPVPVHRRRRGCQLHLHRSRRRCRCRCRRALCLAALPRARAGRRRARGLRVRGRGSRVQGLRRRPSATGWPLWCSCTPLRASAAATSTRQSRRRSS